MVRKLTGQISAHFSSTKMRDTEPDTILLSSCWSYPWLTGSKVQVTVHRSRVQVIAPLINYQTTQIPLDLIEHFVKRLGLGDSFNVVHLSLSWWPVLWLVKSDLYFRPAALGCPLGDSCASVVLFKLPACFISGHMYPESWTSCYICFIKFKSLHS